MGSVYELFIVFVIIGHTAAITEARLLDPIRNIFSPVRSRSQARQNTKTDEWFSQFRVSSHKMKTIEPSDFDPNSPVITNTPDLSYPLTEFDTDRGHGYMPISPLFEVANVAIKTSTERPKPPPKSEKKCKDSKTQPKCEEKCKDSKAPLECPKKCNDPKELSECKCDPKKPECLIKPKTMNKDRFEPINNSREQSTIGPIKAKMPVDDTHNSKLPSDGLKFELPLNDGPYNSELPSDRLSNTKLPPDGPYKPELPYDHISDSKSPSDNTQQIPKLPFDHTSDSNILSVGLSKSKLPSDHTYDSKLHSAGTFDSRLPSGDSSISKLPSDGPFNSGLPDDTVSSSKFPSDDPYNSKIFSVNGSSNSVSPPADSYNLDKLYHNLNKPKMPSSHRNDPYNLDKLSHSLSKSKLFSHYSSNQSTDSPYYFASSSNGPYNTESQSEAPYNSELPPESPYNPESPSEDLYNSESPSDGSYNSELSSEDPYNSESSSDNLYNSELPSEGPYNFESPSDGPYNSELPPEKSYKPELPSDSPYNFKLPSSGPYNPEWSSESPYNSRLPSNHLISFKLPSDDQSYSRLLPVSPDSKISSNSPYNLKLLSGDRSLQYHIPNIPNLLNDFSKSVLHSGDSNNRFVIGMLPTKNKEKPVESSTQDIDYDQLVLQKFPEALELLDELRRLNKLRQQNKANEHKKYIENIKGKNRNEYDNTGNAGSMPQSSNVKNYDKEEIAALLKPEGLFRPAVRKLTKGKSYYQAQPVRPENEISNSNETVYFID
ncbi:hypothetical protein PYW08_011688 [Mythimna loreyi]|uniref:Uncharacterized protein n=1 Tax=Mythimna loreyi TaxID=667449 RepID=A0ACC2QL53_9NEOP|nr:hypothetical protein PYW08_011688 [Mythimna loreyi]